MSVTGALSSGGPVLAIEPREMIRPFWLRPLALVAILAVHGLMFYEVRGKPAALSPLDAVEVTLVPLGDSAEDQNKQEEVKPAEPEPQPPPPQAARVEPVEPVEPPAPPPQVVAPEAPPLPVEEPKPVVPPPMAVEEKKPPPKPVEAQQDKRKEREIAERRRKAQEARQQMKRGAANGAEHASAMSPAAYAGLLSAEIRRRTFYPAAARAAGATGVVGVAFTIGPSGRVISQSITRSSGNATLDAAAHTTLSAIHTPPPPGGRYSTSTNLRFHFN